MAEKELRFTCWNCQKENTVIVTVTTQLASQSKPVPVAHYCESCNRPNKLPVPDNVDVHVFILGRDEGFLRYTPQGIPVLQGEKYP
jgi:transcription elongation factor Elf1